MERLSLILVLVIISTAFNKNLVTNGQLIPSANYNDWLPVSEDQQSWMETIEQLDTLDLKGPLTNLLHRIFKALKSSSFPTAVANLTNEKCVRDSQLYVHALYNLAGSSNTSWARQSNLNFN